jgi:hypothetical protein
MAIRLVIEVNDQGALSVNGPIHDKVLCYGLLEGAKDAIRQHQATQETRRIIPAGILPVPMRNGG